jgi:hypothetical protein
MIKHGSTTSLQRAKALTNCAQDYHQWHPTFSLGENLCTVCDLHAYCPLCLSRPPTTARLVPCALHRSERRAEV